MAIDLTTAARIAKNRACQEVNDAMEAHGRYNPLWEVQECGMSYAIRNGLLAYIRTLPEPRPRVACEYGEVMINVDFPVRRVVDVAVLHPLLPVADAKPYGYANTAVLGLIEVKRERAKAHEDAARFSKVTPRSTTPGRSLEWLLLAILFTGTDAEHVRNRVDEIQPKLHNLELITEVSPQQARGPGSEVAEPWFDVVGFGMKLDAR